MEQNLYSENKLPRMLLVDDDFNSLIFMQKYLEEFFVLHAAVDVDEAMQLSVLNYYVGFLVDIKLAGTLTGIELVSKLRALNKYKTSPIIAVTGNFRQNDISYLKNEGFTDVIIKPFTKEKLLDTIQHSLFTEK